MAVTLPSPPRADKRWSAPPVEPLENGDLLTAGEFLRRYEAMPHVKKAELIERVVYMGSPVRIIHAKPDTMIQGWLHFYSAHTPGTEAAGNATVRLDVDNVPQPDALLRLLPECGGRSRVDAEGYLAGPPELIVEITASSASIDLRDKLRVYRRNGVREYLVWRTVENQFDWFVLETAPFPSTRAAKSLAHRLRERPARPRQRHRRYRVGGRKTRLLPPRLTGAASGESAGERRGQNRDDRKAGLANHPPRRLTSTTYVGR